MVGQGRAYRARQPHRRGHRPLGLGMAETGVRPAPGTFSLNEAIAIRRMALAPGTEFVCPRCGGHLGLGTVVTSGHNAIWELRCETCQCGLLVRGRSDDASPRDASNGPPGTL